MGPSRSTSVSDRVFERAPRPLAQGPAPGAPHAARLGGGDPAGAGARGRRGRGPAAVRRADAQCTAADPGPGLGPEAGSGGSAEGRGPGRGPLARLHRPPTHHHRRARRLAPGRESDRRLGLSGPAAPAAADLQPDGRAGDRDPPPEPGAQGAAVARAAGGVRHPRHELPPQDPAGLLAAPGPLRCRRQAAAAACRQGRGGPDPRRQPDPRRRFRGCELRGRAHAAAAGRRPRARGQGRRLRRRPGPAGQPAFQRGPDGRRRAAGPDRADRPRPDERRQAAALGARRLDLAGRGDRRPRVAGRLQPHPRRHAHGRPRRGGRPGGPAGAGRRLWRGAAPALAQPGPRGRRTGRPRRAELQGPEAGGPRHRPLEDRQDA